MYHRSKTLNQTKNGLLVFCKSCGVYHLTFGHFYLELTKTELHYFGTYITELDVDYWENKCSSCTMKRKIPIPTQQTNLCLLLNRTEVEELKTLLATKGAKDKIDIIKVKDIDYDFIKN